MNHFDIPILINARDRLTDLVALTFWLESHGYENITLLDNASTYPPLLDYLDRTAHNVVRLGENVGAHAPWMCELGRRPDDWFVYSDCDILPVDECPADLIEHLYEVLQRNPDYPKAGPSLYNAGIPTRHIREWEQGSRINGPVMDHTGARDSLIDTTFALYRPGFEFENKALRTPFPYQATHMPWYRTGELDAEHRYYLEHAKHGGPSGTTSWEQAA